MEIKIQKNVINNPNKENNKISNKIHNNDLNPSENMNHT